MSAAQKREHELSRFDGVEEQTGVRRRLAANCQGCPVNPHLAVCVGLFIGGDLTHEVYGANRMQDAVRHARRLRATGVGARLVWLNTDAWNRDLWVQDLTRPVGTPPGRFYGPIPEDLT